MTLRIRLTRGVAMALGDLAERERRTPEDQAAVLLERRLLPALILSCPIPDGGVAEAK